MSKCPGSRRETARRCLSLAAALLSLHCGSPPSGPSTSQPQSIAPPNDLTDQTAETLCALEAAARALGTTASSSGDLSSADCDVAGVSKVAQTNPGGDGFFESLHIYVAGASAEDIDLEVRSTDFDAALALFELGSNEQLIERAVNDDRSGLDPNPRIRYRFRPGTGYLAVISGVDRDETGRYTFTSQVVNQTSPSAPPAPGQIRVTTTTAGTGGPFTAVVGSGKTKSIGANASVDFTNLGPGSYAVSLTNLGANCATSSPNPVSATVASNQSTSVSFAVACSGGSGDLVVRANTSGSNLDPDGYTVSLDQGARVQSLGINGTTTFTQISEGSHTVELQGVAANCVASNPTRTPTVPANGQASEVFDVVCQATPEPDLVVSSLTSSPSAPLDTDAITITAIVENVGTAQAGASEVEIDFGGESSPPRFAVSALAPGATQTVSRTLSAQAVGSYAVTATSDVGATVQESDEGNNSSQINVSVVSTPIPDLVVSSLSHAPANPTAGQTITITAVVENVGSGQAGASTLEIDEGLSSTPPTFAVPALGPGQTQTVTHQLVLPGGQHTITATADLTNAVGEADEGNNVAQETFTVVGWDLVVSSVSHSPTNPTSADVITITAEVENIGTGQAGASELEISVDGETNPPRFAVPALDANQIYVVTRQIKLFAGTHQVWATADIGGVVPELSEGNNATQDIFPVTSVPPNITGPQVVLIEVNSSNCSHLSPPGNYYSVTVSYADIDSDVVQGTTIQWTGTFSGGSTWGPTVRTNPALTGNGASGTVSDFSCVTFGSNTSATWDISITDAGGQTSNVVSVTKSKPAGGN